MSPEFIYAEDLFLLRVDMKAKVKPYSSHVRASNACVNPEHRVSSGSLFPRVCKWASAHWETMSNEGKMRSSKLRTVHLHSEENGENAVSPCPVMAVLLGAPKYLYTKAVFSNVAGV